MNQSDLGIVQGFNGPSATTLLLTPPTSQNLQDSLDSIDTHMHMIWDERTLQFIDTTSISSTLLQLFYFIKELSNSEIANTQTICKIMFSSSRAAIYASPYCCGFTAPTIAGILILLSLSGNISSISSLTLDKFNLLLDEGIPLQFKITDSLTENMIINRDNLSEKLVIFFLLMSGYANIQGMGWNTRCVYNPDINLDNLINLITLHGQVNEDGGCTTYHHFIVITIEDYCIISDSWAGASGCRPLWTRLMLKLDLLDVLNKLNDCNALNNSQDILDRTTYLKEYFDVPDNPFVADYLVFIGVLTGTKLEEMFWKYTYKGTSKMERKSTTEAKQMLKYISENSKKQSIMPKVIIDLTEDEEEQGQVTDYVQHANDFIEQILPVKPPSYKKSRIEKGGKKRQTKKSKRKSTKRTKKTRRTKKRN